MSEAQFQALRRYLDGMDTIEAVAEVCRLKALQGGPTDALPLAPEHERHMLKKLAAFLRKLADRLDPPSSNRGGGPGEEGPP